MNYGDWWRESEKEYLMTLRLTFKDVGRYIKRSADITPRTNGASIHQGCWYKVTKIHIDIMNHIEQSVSFLDGNGFEVYDGVLGFDLRIKSRLNPFVEEELEAIIEKQLKLIK